jgi:4-alpha-glucanotransferase
MAEFAGIAPPNESTNYLTDFLPAILQALFGSESWIAIVMITDLLGRKDRFNVPGTAANSNWSRRLPGTIRNASASRDRKQLLLLVRGLLEKSGRSGPA